MSEPAPIAIRAEPSPVDPDSCRFTVSRTVHAGGPYFFTRADGSAGSPLIERLFQVAGVVGVLVQDDVVLVAKAPQATWSDLMKPVGAAIRERLTSGVPCIVRMPESRSRRSTDAQIREAVQELLDREVNPSIAAHGGKIAIADVKDGVLSIAMTGGCQGCAASQLTLRQGVEVMVRRAVPEVRAIVDVTDHAAGTSPFYDRI